MSESDIKKIQNKFILKKMLNNSINSPKKAKTKNGIQIKFLTMKTNHFQVDKLEGKYKKKDSLSFKSKEGRWTEEEQDKFLEGIVLYGINWKKIKCLIESRTAVQVRSHAQKYFQKMKSCKDEILGIDFTLDSISNIQGMINQIKSINSNFDVINVLKYLEKQLNKECKRIRNSIKTNKDEKNIFDLQKDHINDLNNLENNNFNNNNNIYNQNNQINEIIKLNLNNYTSYNSFLNNNYNINNILINNYLLNCLNISNYYNLLSFLLYNSYPNYNNDILLNNYLLNNNLDNPIINPLTINPNDYINRSNIINKVSDFVNINNNLDNGFNINNLINLNKSSVNPIVNNNIYLNNNIINQNSVENIQN